MVVDRSGRWWKGSDRCDIDEYLADFSAERYPVRTVRHARCATCGCGEFTVRLDDEEGCAGARLGFDTLAALTAQPAEGGVS